jgi:hypothetical protein
VGRPAPGEPPSHRGGPRHHNLGSTIARVLFCRHEPVEGRYRQPSGPRAQPPDPLHADSFDWALEAAYQRHVEPMTGINYDKVQQAGTSLHGTTAQPSGERTDVAEGDCTFQLTGASLVRRTGVYCQGKRAERRDAGASAVGTGVTARRPQRRQRLTFSFSQITPYLSIICSHKHQFCSFKHKHQ